MGKQASWAGAVYSNASSAQHEVDAVTMNCSRGCLFDVVADMTEHVDVAAQNTAVVGQMAARLQQLPKGFFSNEDEIPLACPHNVTDVCACWMAKNHWGDFFGPYAGQIAQQTAFETTAEN